MYEVLDLSHLYQKLSKVIKLMNSLNLDIFDISTLFFSWYIKPYLLNDSFINSTQNITLMLTLFLTFSIINLLKLIITSLIQVIYTVKVTSFLSIFMGLKFIILIGLLIVVRGGIPRYRYDFLTKLGWIKTLSLVLIIFLVNLLLSYL